MDDGVTRIDLSDVIDEWLGARRCLELRLRPARCVLAECDRALLVPDVHELPLQGREELRPPPALARDPRTA